MDIFFSVLMVGFMVVVLVNTIYSHFYKVVNMPSSPNTRRVILDDIRAVVGDCDSKVIYDLGSGWGGLCRRLSHNFSAAHVKGFEISPIPYAVSKFFSLFFRYSVTRADLFKTDISNTDIIICYLSPYHMAKLADKVVNECKKGTIIYSQGFPFQSIEPDDIINIPFSIEKKLYRYKI